MESIRVILQNPNGFHAQTAALFVKTAIQFRCHILVRCKDREVDAKKMMGVLALEAQTGDELEILAEGPDENEAIDTLKTFIVND